MSSIVQLEYYGTDEPFWVDNAWLDTVVVVGLTCFILCLMKLSKVSTSKMGMIYGVVGMAALIIGYWVSMLPVAHKMLCMRYNYMLKFCP